MLCALYEIDCISAAGKRAVVIGGQFRARQRKIQYYIVMDMAHKGQIRDSLTSQPQLSCIFII
jgi:hypothetical protein